MVEEWVFSDTHFWHGNILKFTDGNDPLAPRIRPFNSLADMHDEIIRKCRDVIGPRDIVHHLGDVTFGYKPWQLEATLGQIPGRKHLYLGNHDKLKGTDLLAYFEKVQLWLPMRKLRLTLSHIPLRLEELRGGTIYNVHGHTHQRILPHPNYINVCVEHTSYGPIHVDAIMECIKLREWSNESHPSIPAKLHGSDTALPDPR